MSVSASIQRRLLRTDWLRELQGLLVVGLALTAVGMIAVIAMTIRGPLPVSVPAGHLVDGGTLHGLTGGAQLDQHGNVDVSVADPTRHQAILGVLTVLPSGLVVLTMLAGLYRVIRDARRRDPFTDTTVRRLRQLSAVVILGGLLAWIGEFIAQFALTGTVTPTGWAGTLPLAKPLIWLLVAFGYLAVAEIINRGRAMRAELEQVI